jgi:hypothetical protein
MFPVSSDSQEEPALNVSVQLPPHSSSKVSQAKKDRHVEKAYLKQTS